MTPEDLEQLRRARKLLEHPSVGARIAHLIGTPVEKAISLLPTRATRTIGNAAQKAIHLALRIALKTMHPPSSAATQAGKASKNWQHLLAVTITGAGGGLIGLPALAVELPLSTGIMMRSIADVARSEGADIHDPQTQLECVQILALGAKNQHGDGVETGYFIAREAFSRSVKEASLYIARHGVQKESAPAIVRFIAQVVERYSISVTEKSAAQLVPIVGGVGGAAINAIFIDHFQDLARGHFIVRRLERLYGPDLVQQTYLSLA